MSDISFSRASAAYRDATRIAEKIVSETDAGSATAVESGAAMKPNFTELLSGSLEQARDAGYGSEKVSTKAVANQAELHDLVSAVSNAELTLNTVVAIRDRVIGAYQDIIKMPI